MVNPPCPYGRRCRNALYFSGTNGYYPFETISTVGSVRLRVRLQVTAEKQDFKTLPKFAEVFDSADLEKFAKTGHLPERLQVLSPLLTPEVRELLTKRFSVDPAFADKFINDLMSISDPASTVSTATTIVKERRGEETKSLCELTQGVSLAFIEQLTPEAKFYQPFLTPAYAQSFSTPQLPLRLISELPTSIKLWLELFAIRNS